MPTAWMVTKSGFEKVELLAEEATHRKVKIVEGDRAGQEIQLPAAGLPNREFNPSLYVAEQPPQVWNYKGRSLPLVNHADFADPLQARALVPEIEPYSFLPHTSQVIDGILAGDHQLFFGPTGVGKTSLVLQLAARIGQPVIRMNFNGHLSVSDIVGSVGFSKDGTTWNDGALPRAMRNGFWLVLDEFDFGTPDILSIFYPVLERTPRLCLKEHDGEIVQADPRFRVFATGNSIGGDQDGRYCGTSPLNAALLNRFSGHGQVINIAAMSAKQEREVLQARLPNLPRRLIKRACEFASRLRSSDSQNQALLPTFSTRELIQFCCKMAAYRNASKAAELTFLAVVQDPNVRQPIEQAIKLMFGNRVVVRSGTGNRFAKEKTKVPTEAGGTGSAFGRVASQVTDPSEIEAIWKSYRGNGGTLSFEQIEREPKFNLRQANGTTAYRIIKRHGAKKCDVSPPLREETPPTAD